MATQTLSIPDLAKQLSSLTDAQALDLLSSIEGLTARAAAARAVRTRAEAERDARALTCDCGKPVARFRFLDCVEETVTLGTTTRRVNGEYVLKGGYVAQGDTWDGGQVVPSTKPVFTTVWFSCEDRNCNQWIEIEGGSNTHLAGWE